MVFESLVKARTAENQIYKVFFLGILYVSLAIVFSLWVFSGQGSLIMVTLTMLAATHLMYVIIRLEEKKDIKINKERMLLKEHGKALKFFAALFFGFLVAFSLWFVFLPYETSQELFDLQLATIISVNNPATGNFISASNEVSKLFFSNVRVMAFSIIFSFAYGIGAIFILTWNASVIGAAIGSFVRNNLGLYSNKLGFYSVSDYMQHFSVGLLRYSIHGIPEMIAYFTAALAGGIISMAIIKHDIKSKNFTILLKDSASLLVLAILILYIAALIEVYVSPSIR